MIEEPKGNGIAADTAPGGWAEPLDCGNVTEPRVCEFCGCTTNRQVRRCCNKGFEIDRPALQHSPGNDHG